MTNDEQRPPRFLALVARLLIRGDDAGYIRADLDASFARDVERGLPRRAATRRYARNVLGSTWSTWAAELRRTLTQRHSAVLPEIRYALRRLRRTPGFLLAAAATVAIAIGVNAATFAIVHAVLLRPLPYTQPDDLVVLQEERPSDSRAELVAPGTYLDWSAALQGVTGLSAYQSSTQIWSHEDRTADVVRVTQVSVELLPMLGLTPHSGRYFQPAEAEYGADRVAVLSHRFWREQLAGEPDAIGRELDLGGRRYQVVGVAPEALSFPDGATDLWVPLTFIGARNPDNRRFHFLNVVGRLAPDSGLEEARQELRALSEELASRYPGEKAGWGARIDTLLESEVASARPAVRALGVAAGLLLLVACVNLSGLFLGRASAASQEIATRVAIGAGRAHVVRHLFLESFLVAGLGGVGALLVAHTSLAFLPTLVPEGVRGISSVGVDERTLAVCLGLVVVSGLLSGAIPAIRVSRTSVASSMRTGRGISASRGAQLARGGLVTAQLALAIVLLAGASLLLRSMQNRASIEPGFTPERGYRALLVFPRGTNGEARLSAYREIESHLQSTPGVTAAGFVQTVPTMPAGIEIEYSRSPSEVAETAPAMATEYQVTPGYFGAMGIGLLRGRAFSQADRLTTPRVVVVNETLARSLVPGRSAVGERLTVMGSESNREWEIVGVVSDLRTGDLTELPRPQLYTPYAQLENPYGDPIAVVRVADDVERAEELIRQALATARPELPIANVRPLQADLSDAVARERLITWLLSGFAAIAVGLAALGLYGIVLGSVQQRMHELSVRMMLGATAPEIFGMVLRYAAWFTGLGLALGVCLTVPVSLTLTRCSTMSRRPTSRPSRSPCSYWSGRQDYRHLRQPFERRESTCPRACCRADRPRARSNGCPSRSSCVSPPARRAGIHVDGLPAWTFTGDSGLGAPRRRCRGRLLHGDLRGYKLMDGVGGVSRITWSVIKPRGVHSAKVPTTDRRSFPAEEPGRRRELWPLAGAISGEYDR